MKYFYTILYEGISEAKDLIGLSLVTNDKQLYVYAVGKLDATLTAIQKLPENQQDKFYHYIKTIEKKKTN